MVILLKSRGETFFQRDSIPILVPRTGKTRKFKLLYFQNETCDGNGNLYKDLFFVYLQPSVNKNSYNVAILTLQFGDVTVKTIYSSADQNTFCFYWFSIKLQNVIINRLLFNKPFARWLHFTTTTRILQAFVIKTSLGLPNLDMKGKTKSILVVVVKRCHHANGLYKLEGGL